jgi:hypothetical protein
MLKIGNYKNLTSFAQAMHNYYDVDHTKKIGECTCLDKYNLNYLKRMLPKRFRYFCDVYDRYTCDPVRRVVWFCIQMQFQIWILAENMSKLTSEE